MFGNDIPEAARERIREFVAVFLPRCTDVAVTVPVQMQVGKQRDDGWWRWQAVESPVTETDIADLEAEYQVKIPTLFKAYLQYQCLLMTEFFVTLPETPSDAPLAQLRGLLELIKTDSAYTSNGWIPFARDPEGAGPVCFVNRGEESPAVVRIERDGNGSLKAVPVADSFEQLLDQIEAELRSYDN